MTDIEAEFVQLARFAVEGRKEDLAMLARRTLRGISHRRPDLANDAKKLIASLGDSPARSVSQNHALPFDFDTRLDLIRREDQLSIGVEPIWPASVATELRAVLDERRRVAELSTAGLSPTKSLLFVGPPGVGKTLAARWIANQLDRSLLTLDLAAVMSSFLGKTGNNIRTVLEYARQGPSVLLLDEFDAIAKRRDDTGEIGELKRLVTVLVQAVDEWPAEGLLIAATNHPELLDPAIWRRFDRVVRFPLPTRSEIEATLRALLRATEPTHVNGHIEALATMLEGKTFAEVTSEVLRARREAVLNGGDDVQALLRLAAHMGREAALPGRISLATELAKSGHSQRKISEFTGLSRDTIRKYVHGAKSRAPKRS
jgi:SpoVK/Ycf46/Vps4 family AAA+-type ATPase